MAKKYLTLEEAAELLSMSKEELMRRRESQEVRGFADRGNWKFKVEDIEQLRRTRQMDSDPDVPILGADSAIQSFRGPDRDLAVGGDSGVLEAGDSGPLGGLADSGVIPGESNIIDADDDDFSSSDSDVRLVMDDLLVPDDSSDAEIGLAPLDDSDSDIRLTPGAALADDSDSDVKLMDDDSDSDVKLVDTGEDATGSPGAGTERDIKKVLADSDSDVKLVSDDSDSDITLSPDDQSSTDSDIRLVKSDSPSKGLRAPFPAGSDSDVRLVAEPLASGSDSDVQLVDARGGDDTSDSDIALIGADDSSISLDLGTGSGSSVLSDESGIALVSDSSMALASESGISLEGPSDSGISLDLGDEGITLADDFDSGISLDDPSSKKGGKKKQSGTLPMLDAVSADDVPETQFEIPSLSDDDSEFELDPLGSSGDRTNVLDLDDSSEQTAMLPGLDDSGAMDDAVFDVDEDASGEFSGDVDLDEDVLGEDDELDDLDVFDEDADDYEDGFASGTSQAEFRSSRGPRRGHSRCGMGDRDLCGSDRFQRADAHLGHNDVRPGQVNVDVGRTDGSGQCHAGHLRRLLQEVGARNAAARRGCVRLPQAHGHARGLTPHAA